jgi:predicted dehydrogenase
VDSRQSAKAAKLVTGKAPAIVSDFRRVLERKDIDAVVVATPDHWHAFIAIQACAAGKDVYVEKPISTSVREGRLMVEAARKHNRVMQVGIQQRSGLHFQRAVELVQSGAIGKVVYAEAWNHGHGPANSAGAPRNEQPPAELDWNMWLGPAPASDYRPGVHPGRWRVFYDYGGGNLADWGVHLIDVIQWAMKVDAPLSAQAVGGAYWMRDGRDTPDTVNVIYEYPGFMVNYTHMNRPRRQVLRHHLSRQRCRFGSGSQRLRNVSRDDEACDSDGGGEPRRVRRHARHGHLLQLAAGRRVGHHVPAACAARRQLPGLHALAPVACRRHRNRLPRHATLPFGKHRLPRRG